MSCLNASLPRNDESLEKWIKFGVNFGVNSRAGSWSLRALRHECDCGPLVYIYLQSIIIASDRRSDMNSNSKSVIDRVRS